jgi:mRNA-degrading endonuclease RelE of RelBE toxin-antitoxin system
MIYAVYTTNSFDKEIESLSESDKKRIQRIFLQLKVNPYVGDQIQYRFFREKRMNEKRVYYLIYDELSAVLVVAFGGKKAQQGTIDRIIELFPEFKIYLKKLLKRDN